MDFYCGSRFDFHSTENYGQMTIQWRHRDFSWRGNLVQWGGTCLVVSVPHITGDAIVRVNLMSLLSIGKDILQNFLHKTKTSRPTCDTFQLSNVRMQDVKIMTYFSCSQTVKVYFNLPLLVSALHVARQYLLCPRLLQEGHYIKWRAVSVCPSVCLSRASTSL